MALLWDPVVAYDASMSSYWEDETFLADTTKLPLAEHLVTGSYMVCKFTREVGAGLTEDLAMYGMHFSVAAGPGAPMSRLDAADALRVETSFQTNFWQPLQPKIANDWQLRGFDWRHFGADFPQDKNGFSKHGPIWRTVSFSDPGTDTQPRLPDQIALTLTFRTASRQHWGRIYTGGWTISSVADSKLGHAVSPTVDLLAGGFDAFLVDINNDARETNMWIWSPKYRGACTVNELSVDDTWDVIRSRRAKYPSYRKTYTS